MSRALLRSTLSVFVSVLLIAVIIVFLTNKNSPAYYYYNEETRGVMSQTFVKVDFEVFGRVQGN